LAFTCSAGVFWAFTLACFRALTSAVFIWAFTLAWFDHLP
jgi:hypothetical protein